MALIIHTLVIGPLENNTYVVADSDTSLAAVIDPSFDTGLIPKAIQDHAYSLSAIWLTHAHFDHIAGVSDLRKLGSPEPLVWLHPSDLELWRQGGGSKVFGIPFDSGPKPSHDLMDGQKLTLGNSEIEVMHTPGHSPGHVVFYSRSAGVVFCGDLIFQNSVGRTDLPGGDKNELLASIYRSILTLPLETRLLSGHGPETTVADEIEYNPYLN